MAKKNTSREIALIFADAHLQRKTWKHRPIYGDAYHGWRQIFDYALDHDIQHLFGLGDLFDSRINEPSPLAFAVEQFRRLQRGPKYLMLHYIQGQHELDDVRVLRIAEQLGVAEHIHGQPVDLPGGLIVWGMDYQPADRIQEALAQIPSHAHVLAAHQVWGDLMGSIALPQADFAHIPTVQQLWTGDYHQWVLDDYRGKEGQELKVLSPGATHQCPDISSPSDCYFVAVTADGNLHRKQLNTRMYADWHLANNDQLEEFLGDVEAFLEGAAEHAEQKHLPPELHTPLWRIIHASTLKDAERRINKVVGDRAHLFYKEVRTDEESTVESAQQSFRSTGKALTLQSCLAEEVSQEEQPEVFALCQRLLDAGEGKEAVQQTLAAWKKEALDANE